MAPVSTLLDVISLPWLSVIVGMIGLAIGGFIHGVGGDRTRLSWGFSGSNLLGLTDAQVPNGITVRYRDNDIPRLTRTVVAVWNSGEETIHPRHVEPADQLSIRFAESDQILSAAIIAQTRPDILASLRPSIEKPNHVGISFEFLNKNDGLVVELFHTGIEIRPTVTGKILSLPNGFQCVGHLHASPAPKVKNALERLICRAGVEGFLGGGLILMAVGGYAAIIKNAAFPLSAALLAPGLIYLMAGAFYVCQTQRKYPRKLPVPAV